MESENETDVDFSAANVDYSRATYLVDSYVDVYNKVQIEVYLDKFIFKNIQYRTIKKIVISRML